MDRGAWQAIQSMGSQRVRHDWAINFHFLFLSNVNINRSCMCKPSQLFFKRIVIPVIYWCVTCFPKVSGIKPQSFCDALILGSGIWMRHECLVISHSIWYLHWEFSVVEGMQSSWDYITWTRGPFQDAAYLTCLVVVGHGRGWTQLGLSAQWLHVLLQLGSLGIVTLLTWGGCPLNKVGICCMAFYTLALGDTRWHVHCIGQSNLKPAQKGEDIDARSQQEECETILHCVLKASQCLTFPDG